MQAALQITEYYELVALHKALMVARFARNSLNPAISGSPYLASIANQIVEILKNMEIERGKPERAKDWQIKIVPNSEVWQIAVANAASEPDLWKKQTNEEKIKFARIFLSPFDLTDEIIDNFIHQVDERTNG